MEVRINIIAKKYAVAFLNLFFGEMSQETIDKLYQLKDFLKKNQMFYVYLNIPTISILVKQKALTRLAQNFDLDKSVKKLMFILLEHGRLEILDKVISNIIIRYRELKDIKLFVITTSHSLFEKEKNDIIKFVKHISSGGVITFFNVDEKLICGFRIQSRTFLWERSILKQLRDIKKTIYRQVGL